MIAGVSSRSFSTVISISISLRSSIPASSFPSRSRISTSWSTASVKLCCASIISSSPDSSVARTSGQRSKDRISPRSSSPVISATWPIAKCRSCTRSWLILIRVLSSPALTLREHSIFPRWTLSLNWDFSSVSRCRSFSGMRKLTSR